jgi:hypothetical protein|tara:strand:- start:246 stop:452 length:207 start_codon:yes stop_codon:yes gene_type:complete
MRNQIIENTIALLAAKVNQHRINIELILTNQKVIPEHTDLTEAILGELKLLAEYNDQLETFKKYFEGN